MKKPVILCVDDEQIVMTSLKEQLKHHFSREYRIETVENGREALEIFQELLKDSVDIPVIIADHIMPVIKGDELLKQIHALAPNTLKILLTGHADADAVGNALNYANLYRYIAKPWKETDLVLTVREALRSYFRKKELEGQHAILQQMNRELQQEIIKRKRTGEALAASQTYARNIIASSLDMIIAVDKDRRIIEFNKAAQEHLGYQPEQILGKPISILYADPLEAETVYHSMIEKAQCIREIHNKRKNGEVFPCLLSASILRDTQGEVVGSMGISRDITEYKKTEEALRESEEKYRVLFENLQDVFYRSDVMGNITLVSPSVQTLLGYTPEEVSELNLIRDIYVGFEQRREFMSRINQRGYIDGFEVQLKRKDGADIWVSTNSHLYKDKKGEILGVEGIFRDITKRKQAQAELIAAHNELKETLENLKRTQTQLLQSERMAALGQLASGIAHEINTPAGVICSAIEEIDRVYVRLPEQLTDTLINLPGELRALYLKTYRHVLFSDKPLSTHDRRIQAKSIRKKLSEHGIETTHSLCSQLAAVGFSEDDIDPIIPLLASQYLEQIQQSLYLLGTSQIHVKNVKLSITQVTQLVNALKHYSHLNEGTLIETNLQEDIDNTLLILKHTLRTITVHRDYEALPLLTCYASQLNQVWTNLIQNAIQAMQGEGNLYVRLKRCNEQELAVEIEDTGPGIPDEILSKIFAPYFSTRSLQDKGIGMGLTICRQIVEQHQGHIEVIYSEPGKTCFRVVLPLFVEYPEL